MEKIRIGKDFEVGWVIGVSKPSLCNFDLR